MKKIIGLIATAILFANASYAEESQGTVCENNGGRWYWDGSINQWQCNMNWRQQQQNGISKLVNECKNGTMLSCYVLATDILEGHEGYQHDITFAINLLTSTCQNGYDLSCGRLGNEYYSGRNVQGSTALATKYYEKGCELKSHKPAITLEVDDCYMAGRFYRNGEGVSRDKYKALELFRKSCDLGTEKACVDYNKLVRE
jgi:hypothetical protein